MGHHAFPFVAVAHPSRMPFLPCRVAAALLGCMISGFAQEPFCVAQDVELAPASLAGFESYGRSVALDGDRAAIGAPTSRRVAVWSTDGVSWTEEAVVQSLAPGAGWGTSVALAGDVLVVGAPFDSTAGADAGSVTVFDFNGGTWTEAATLTPSDPLVGRRFGDTLAIQDGVIVVGAPGDTARGVDGVVYVFAETQGQWLEEGRLTPTSGGVAGFGSSLALELPRLLVGSPSTDRVHVYNRVTGAWSEGAGFAQAGSGIGFGWSLALSGDLVLVGAPFDDTQGTNAGAVSLWEFTGIFWVNVQDFYPSDALAKDGFGVAVAFDGTRFVVGADGAPIQGSTGTVLAPGHAYLFAERNGTWQEQARFAASAGAAGDFFGRSIDLASDVILVGSPGSDLSGPLSGSASIFRLGASETTFGSGVAGTGGFLPTVSLSACAAVNQSFEIQVSDGAGGAPGILLWSAHRGSISFGAGEILVGLPISNSVAHVLGGGPGAPGEGWAAFPVAIDNVGLMGQTVVMQAGYLDANAAGGFSLSPGFELLFP